MNFDFREKARIFKALSEERRLEILCYLSNEEFCVGDVAQNFNMSASVASHHLKVLESVHLITRRKEGRNVIFKVNSRLLKGLFEEIFEFLEINIEDLN